MHAWVQSPSPTQYTAKKTKKKRPPLRRRTHTHKGLHCVHERKGGLERRCFTFDLVEGRFVEGRGGWRTGPGDQWKSWALTCRTCEKDPLVCERVLKAAVKVAVGVKYPTLHLTTHRHTLAKIQMLRQNKRVIHLLVTNFAQMEALAINFSRHVWILAVLITDGWSNFSSASEGRFLLKRAICSDGGWLRGAAALPH